MHDIKFRGKRVDNGELVYGSLHYEEVECEKQYFHDGANNHTLGIDVRPVIEVDDDSSSERLSDYPVIPESVGQFTGRTAQCADMIYEGDRCIVTRFDYNGTDYQYECVVEWVNGGFAFVNTDKGIFIPLWDVGDTDSDVEVIGNIHSTPSLLEVQP